MFDQAVFWAPFKEVYVTRRGNESYSVKLNSLTVSKFYRVVWFLVLKNDATCLAWKIIRCSEFALVLFGRIRADLIKKSKCYDKIKFEHRN